MKQYVNAVSIITVLVLLPMIGLSMYEYIRGGMQFSEFAGMWKEPLMLLVGFWIRGATSGKS